MSEQVKTKVKPCVVCKKDMEYVRETKTTCSGACREAKRYVAKGGRPPIRAIPSDHKWCPKCETVQLLDNYYSGRGGRVYTYCKPCKRSDEKERLRASLGLSHDAPLTTRARSTSANIGDTRPDSAGYLMEKVGHSREAHHRADANGWVYQHILVAEEKYGIDIGREYTVHHQNGMRSDNRPENLDLRVGNHGKGADILPFALRTAEGRELAAKLLEDYGYTVTRPTDHDSHDTV